MVYIDINRSNAHADPLLGSRWAQMWVHMLVHTLVIFLVYITKGNIHVTVYINTCKHVSKYTPTAYHILLSQTFNDTP